MTRVTAPATPRGRPREFDVDAALDAALDQFWTKGYRSTTTRDLEAALGVSQSSMYAAFGAKKDVLLAAIDRYEGQIECELFAVLDRYEAGIDAIAAFFTAVGEWIIDNEHRGCLVVNLMAAETEDEAIVERVRKYRMKIRDGFRAALGRDGGDPELVEQRSELLLAAVLGLHLTAKSGGEDEVVAMLAAIGGQIQSWTAR